MKRRKFLNLSGLGLLSIHGFSRELSGFFQGEHGILAETFLNTYGAVTTRNFVECIESPSFESALRPFFQLGYSQSNLVFQQDEKFLCFPLQLRAGQTVIDEAILVFKNQGAWEYSGTLQANQMFWLLQYKADINIEATEISCLGNVLPESSSRFIENNFTFYQCGLGEIGFFQSCQPNGFNIAGKLRRGGHEIFTAEITQPGLYPEKNLFLSYSNM